MKKILSRCCIGLLIYISCICVGCSSTKVYTNDDLSLHDKVNDITISLGMPRADVEELLGEPISVDSGKYVYQALNIGYKDGLVNLLTKSGLSADASIFETPEGISRNSSPKDFFREYPTAIDSQTSGSLCLYKDGDSYMDISSEVIGDYLMFPEEYDQENIYILSFWSHDWVDSISATVDIATVNRTNDDLVYDFGHFKTAGAEWLAQQYDFYGASVCEIQSGMDITWEQADEVFMTLVVCGVNTEIFSVMLDLDSELNRYYTISYNAHYENDKFTNDILHVYMDNGTVVQVLQEDNIIFP